MIRQFDVAVLGAGPVGLIAGLQLARSGRSVMIASSRLPAADGPRRVDAVSAAFLALLTEFGIHPAAVGVDRLHRARLSAWPTAEPLLSDTAATAHVERPALDLELLRAAMRAGCEVQPGFRLGGGEITRRDWTARRSLDATGRAAVSAARRVRPEKPWIARSFWAPVGAHHRGFAIAQLPDGYAYRLGSASILTLGVAGRREALAGSPLGIAQQLRLHAPWLLQDLPAFADLRPGGGGAASVQWGEGDGLRIGDAALARDALSSQGLAAGTSEALLAAAMASEDDRAAILARQREQRQAHLGSLLMLFETGRFAQAPAWREYGDFLRAQHHPQPVTWTAAVRDQRVRRIGLRH